MKLRNKTLLNSDTASVQSFESYPFHFDFYRLVASIDILIEVYQRDDFG